MGFVIAIHTAIVLLLALAAAVAYDRTRDVSSARRSCAVLGSMLFVWGITGFVGQSFLSHGLQWLVPGSFEWPTIFAFDEARTPGGLRVVAHTSVSRISVYDEKWNFQRGWWIDAHGGAISVTASPDGTITVETAHAPTQFTFDIEGTLVRTVPISPVSFPSDLAFASVHFRGSWPLLWNFAHPFLAWLCLFGGLLLACRKQNKAQKPTIRLGW